MQTWLIITLTALTVMVLEGLGFAYLPEMVDFIFKIFHIKESKEVKHGK